MATEVIKVIDPDSGSGYDYASLYDWEAAQQGDLTGVRDEIAVASCVASSDGEDSIGGGYSNETAIDGWTTSATQYIEIRGYVESPQWNSSLYKMKGYAGANNPLIYNLEDYTRIIGVQIELSNSDNPSAIYSLNATGIIIRNCIGRATSVEASVFVINTTSATISAHSFIINCIAYGSGFGSDTFGAGIYVRADNTARRALAYNCTVYGGYTGIRTRDDYASAVNCLLIGQTEKSFYESPNADHCGWSNDNTTNTNGTNALDLSGYTAAQIFVDAANGDFTLLPSAPAIGYGLNLYNDTYYPFQVDINGDDRGGSGAQWDIGADEYNPIVLYYRTAATPTALSAASWTAYTVPFTSLGYIQLKAEA